MATAKSRVVSEKSSKGANAFQMQPANAFSLQMVSHKKTEMYVKFAKIMIMCQGPYSAERKQVLDKVTKTFNHASYVIKDETYRQHRTTSCSYDRMDEFYEFFRDESQRALEEGNNLVVLDPTMSDQKQNCYYLDLAYKMQYVFLVFPPLVSSSGNDEWPPGSQAHSFRKQRQLKPSNMFQHLFCAWYLHDIDSLELRHVANLFVQDCMEGIPEFANLFARICPDQLSGSDSDDTSDNEYTLEEYREGKHVKNQPSASRDESDAPQRCTPHSFSRYFNLTDQRQDLAYCVVKIFQGTKSMSEYFNDENVVRNFGKMSKLLVAGFVVSPHIVAARIKMTHNQKELWSMPDDVDENMSGNLPCASELMEESKASCYQSTKVRRISSKSNQTLINCGTPIHNPTNLIDQHAKGRTCHIVLGKAPGAPKRNIDYDVAFALKRERSAKDDVIVTDLERCVVKRLGKYWIIYLKEMYSVDAFFASCCKPFAYENAI